VSSSDPIAWRAVTYGTPVTGSDRVHLGTVREMLGSDAEDIFHGVRAHVADGHRDVMIPADEVTMLTADEVQTNLSPAAIKALSTYDDVATYHLASVGWLRKHLGWTKDSATDEEPG
jgi:hypothetical protein